MRALVRAAAYACVALGVFLWLASSPILYPPWLSNRHPDDGFPPLREAQVRALMGYSRDPRQDCGLEYEEVEFRTNSTRQQFYLLRGWFVPSSKPNGSDVAAVLAHGGSQDRREMLRHVPLYHELGMHVLLFDMSDTGLSDNLGRGLSFGAREHIDLLSAVHYLHRSRPYIKRVVLAGTSVGGASCLLAAARQESPLPIAAIVAENPVAKVRRLLRDIVDSTLDVGAITRNHSSPMPLAARVASSVPFLFPNWLRDSVVRLAILRAGVQNSSAARHASRITQPVLLMHGDRDAMTPLWHSETIYSQLTSAADREIHVVPGAMHAEVINVDRDGYTKRVHSFLRKHMALP